MSTGRRRRPSIALIGCGAVSERFHLPALARSRDAWEQVVLVDVDVTRAERLSAELGGAPVARDYATVLGDVDGAIVAVPPRLHVDVVLDCVAAGVDVLCEKPLAESPDQVDRIVDAAKRTRTEVGVNNTRRLHPSTRKVRELIDRGELGELQRIEFELGEEFDWPAASSSYFGYESGGRGVLQDTGAHVLDLLCWWLGGRPDLDACRDDSFGGSEAVADLVLGQGACRIHVRLSWLSKLSNAYEIQGSQMEVRGEVYGWNRLELTSPGQQARTLRLRPGRTEEDFADEMVGNLLHVCLGDARPLVPAGSVADSIALIDRCYQDRQRFELPWLSPAADGREPTQPGSTDRAAP